MMLVHVRSLQKSLKRRKLKDGQYNEQYKYRKRKDSSSQYSAHSATDPIENQR